MMLRVPSFFAAATNVSRPPSWAAEVALCAATAPPDALPLELVPVLLGGAHAVTASAVPSTMLDSSARRDVVTGVASCAVDARATPTHSVDVRSFGVLP